MSRRTLYILLFVSLALNLFVVGAAVGAFVLGERMHHRRPDFRPGPPMMAAAAALPEGQREAYRQALRAQAAVVGPKMRQAHQLRHNAWVRMGAEPVDTAAVTADLDRARALEVEARGDIDRTIVGFAARLPAADRARFAEALARPPRHGPRPGPGPQGPEPPSPP